MASRTASVVGLLSTLVVALAPAGAAQSSGVATLMAASIITGQCAAPGDAVATLIAPSPGPSGIDRIATSITAVEITLEGLSDGAHAVVVRPGADQAGSVACGNISPLGSSLGDVTVALDGLNDSGILGSAFLHEASGRTTVYLTVVAPESTAASAAVSIRDFEFTPAAFMIVPGTTVTWTNQGPSGHTVTADDGSFDSHAIQVGGTFAQTFVKPGNYAYRCLVHPTEMIASIVVG